MALGYVSLKTQIVTFVLLILIVLHLKKIKYELPVKLKTIKVTKKYFNFMVILSKDNKTILEKREGKGIWQNLYQFPLIETVKLARRISTELKT